MRRLVVGLVLAGFVVAGCGGESDEAAVRALATDYFMATQDGDANELCELMSSAMKQQVLSDAGFATGERSCAEVAANVLDVTDAAAQPEIETVIITGDKAAVVFADDSAAHLSAVRVDGRWLADPGEEPLSPVDGAGVRDCLYEAGITDIEYIDWEKPASIILSGYADSSESVIFFLGSDHEVSRALAVEATADADVFVSPDHVLVMYVGDQSPMLRTKVAECIPGELAPARAPDTV